jgi:type VI secretion system protein ImpH
MSEDQLERVVKNAERLPFLRLVRLLEHLLAAPARIGERGPFSAEPVRFHHDPSLVFHTRDVAQAKVVRESGRAAYVEVETTFLGLTGAVSPLPLFLTEELLHEDDDGILQREFLDLFHHRLLGLLYRGLLGAQHAASLSDDGRDVISRWILQLSGFSPDHAARRTGLAPGWLLRLAPLFVTYPDNADRLQVALRDVLGEVLAGAEISITPFAGKPVRLQDDERPRLGMGVRLGQDSVLGRHVPAPASRVQVSMGPLSADGCTRLSPDGDLFGVLSCVGQLFVPEHVEVDFELRPAFTPGARLGGAARLGRTSWLGASARATPLRFRPMSRENA